MTVVGCIMGKVERRPPMSRYDRDTKVGDWEPSDESVGCGVVLAVIIAALTLWGAIAGGMR